jgi:hypothetical protein
MKVRPGHSELRQWTSGRAGHSAPAELKARHYLEGLALPPAKRLKHTTEASANVPLPAENRPTKVAVALALHRMPSAVPYGKFCCQLLTSSRKPVQRASCGAVRAEDMVACCGGSIQCIRSQCPYSRGISRQVRGALTGMCWAFQRDTSKLHC